MHGFEWLAWEDFFWVDPKKVALFFAPQKSQKSRLTPRRIKEMPGCCRSALSSF
jgi:hypothetical protein